MARLRKSERKPSRYQVCSPGIILCGIFVAILAATSTAQELMLNDPMLNSASGVVNGGTFVGNGWRVDDQFDSIIWHIPSISYGAVEWDIRGLYENETRPGMADKSELFHMYDYTYFDADNTYSPGYRNNPYKHFVRKIGPLGANENGFEVVYKIHDEFFEIDTPVVDWNPATTYTFREEWGPDGAGNSYLRLYRDSELLLNESLPGSYSPTGHSVVLGSSARRDPQSSPPIGAVFSNLKVWDLEQEIVLPPLPEPRTGRVDLEGHALQDDDGEFTGLGVTYFQALRRTKYDRARYRNDLDFLARNGVDYIRTLSMVGWYDYWESKEIAPHTFQNENGTTIQGWGDYWQQFRDMIDIAYDEFGIRTQVTIFADAQLMPDETDRINHMDGVLSNIQGREEKVVMLEVANEYWQNGFPDPDGIENVRDFGQYLNDRTEVLVAISSTFGGTNSSLVQMYQGSAADIATEHFTRTNDTVEGGWLPVRAPFRINSVSSVPPVSSNEPIGPGSSVNTENDPIKLVSATAYAWMSGLPMYVFHSNAGVLGNTQFETMAGITNLRHVQELLPGDIANWQRTEGKDTISPFTNYANGVANRWWTEVSNPTSGAVRHIANVRGDEFYTLPIGILGGGLQLQARQNMTIQVFNPLDGTVVLEAMPAANEHLTLDQGPEAYLIRGNFADGGPARIDLDVLDNPHGLVHRQPADGGTIAASITDRNARRNDDPNEDFYFYFDAADWFTYQGDEPLLSITVDYFDQGNGSLTLQYDSNTGNMLAAFYKEGGSIQLTDSDLWKTHTFQVTDAYFGNRQNAESDFRIGGGVGTTFYLDTVSVVASGPPPTDFQWTASSGSWHNSANWSPTRIPNGNDNTVDFTGGGTSITTVLMNSPVTVREISLDGSSSYRLQGSQTLTLDADVGTARLNVTGGNHIWTTPVAADTSTTIDIASGAELTLEGLFDFAGQTVTKSGSGRLYLDSESTIQRGTFQHNDGLLGGDGIVNGDLIASAGSVAPGHGVGQLSVSGDFAMGSDSALEIEIGGTSANQFDTLQVTKHVFLDGTLEVTLTDDYDPDFGQQFSIVQAVSIANSGIVLGGPDGEKFKLIFAPGLLLLESTMAGLPGDYNGNGLVDAVDYTLWRDNLGLDSSVLGGNGSGAASVVQADYDLWKSHFGESVASRSEVDPIPEPASLLLALLALTAVPLHMRHR